MKTYFASAERSGEKELEQQIDQVCKNPVVDGLLSTVNGVLAVLNENRQVLTVNNTLLEMLNMGETAELIGLRPGEVLNCKYAKEAPSGCGTGKSCAACGAVLAILACQNENQTVTRKCAIERVVDGEKDDLFLQVHAVPLNIDERRFLLLFLQDITAQQRWAAMERVFFHDVNNILAGIVSASSLLALESSGHNHEMAERISQSSIRVAQEVAMQQCLSRNDTHAYTPVWSTISAAEVLDEVRRIYETHPAARNKNLSISEDVSLISFNTDTALLYRVLNNMLVNAFEATSPNGIVRVTVSSDSTGITFSVWNEQPIPDTLAQRIFQRNISTKAEMGRGIGTYSMKLFGEKILGGKVSFTTSEQEGTEFRIALNRQ